MYNELDPKTPSDIEKRKIPLIIKVYGFLCLADGIVTLPIIALSFGYIIFSLITHNGSVTISADPTLTFIISVIGAVLTAVSSIALIVFGGSLLRNHRRNAARWSYVLIVFTALDLLVNVMLEGIGPNLIRPLIQMAILVTLSITVDPTLHQEREVQRRLKEMVEREEAAEGMLGRDLTGEGFIKLNFFNLFWVFMVCSFLGLVVETIFHMLFVDPGVYQDRAGVLFGPFSPIYGFGALLMTIALNRFYRSDGFIIFLVSAVIGGAFECFVSWFMQTAFGAVAWDYSGATIFGAPDPIAILCHGRTCTDFACMWGVLGLVWIKLLLPRLLKLINLIPWKMRYGLTAVCATLMIVNGVMTLQALDCWYERLSGVQPNSPVEEFYAKHFDNSYMERRFQSMSIIPEKSARVETEAR